MHNDGERRIEPDGSSALGSSDDTEANDGRDLLDCIAQEYLERRRRGEHVDKLDYRVRYPELGPELDELLTAIDHLEELTPVTTPRSSDRSTPGSRAGSRLGPYQVVREVGRGGMAIVYEATDTQLGRNVALKVLPEYTTTDPRFRERFRREVQAAASLDHSNIVPVYGAGEEDGVHFYAMQLIDGVGVDEIIDSVRRRRSTNPSQPSSESKLGADVHKLLGVDTRNPETYYESVAGLGAEIASALEHAHGRGILHRDLKPSNVLVDADGHAWVTDFGLCKSAAADDLTVSGDVVGTLRYMAPERFSGDGDVRSDVYGVGLVLYELLTLRPAVGGRDRPDIIREVVDETPPAPRKIDSGIPRDLETIVLRATSKLAETRYPTAAALALDLEAFLEGRPIVARRPSIGYLVWLAARRNKWLSGTVAIAVLILIISTAAYILSTHELLRQRDDSLIRTRAIGLSSAATAALQADPMLSLLLAREAVRLHPSPEAWSTLQRAVTAVSEMTLVCHDAPVAWARFANDGSLLSATVDQLSRFDPHGNDRRVTRLARSKSRDGVNESARATGHVRVDEASRYVVLVDSQQRAETFDHTGARVASVADDISAAAFRPDGALPTIYLGTTSGKVGEYSVEGAPLRQLGTLPESVHVLVVTEDDHVVGATRSGQVTVWRPDGEIVASFDVETLPLRVLTVSPEGNEIAVGGGHHVRRYAIDGHPIAEHRGHDDYVLSIAYSPDGRHMVTSSSDQTAHVWNLDTHQRRVLAGHGTAVNEAIFTPDGRSVLTASSDQTAMVWDLRGRPIQTFRGHGGPVHTVDCSNDGRLVVTASSDGTARVWELRSSSTPILRGHSGGLYTAEYSPDGTSILTSSRDQTCRVWDLDGSERTCVQLERFPCFSEFSVDGDSILTATAYTNFHRHSITGKLETSYASVHGRVLAASYRNGVTRLVTRTPENDAHLLVDGELTAVLRGHTDMVWCAAFDATGDRILTGSDDATARLFDSSGHCEQVFEGHDARVRTVYFDTDGQRVITASDDATARLWSLGGTPLATMRGHDGPVLMAVFSPDGQRVLTASRDHTARLWSLDGERLLDLIGHGGVVWSARFSPDGRRVVTSSFDHTARVWIVCHGDLLAAADRRATRELSNAERRHFRDLLEDHVEPTP